MNPARVVVIDEDQEEALLLLSALGRAGIGALYYRGDDEKQLPVSPISGCRLVFLDLQLIPSDNPENYLPFAVKVLTKAVEIVPRITGIVCWTKHQQDIALLKQLLAEAGVVPAFVHSIDDKLGIRNEGSIERILAALEVLTGPLSGRNLLGDWERNVHDATTSVTNSLLQLASDDNELVSLLAAVACGSAEERIQDGSAAAAALRDGLSAIHADEMDNLNPCTGAAPSGDALLAAVEVAKRNPLKGSQKSRLNRALLVARAPRPQPGVVYLRHGWTPPDTFPYKVSAKQIRALLYDYFPHMRDDKQRITTVVDAAVPCILEVTPACDFAQGKCGDARLMAGLLLASTGVDEQDGTLALAAEARTFARDLPFVWLENGNSGLSGAYKLILNARHLLNISFDTLAGQTPLCRLRTAVLTDIRAWFGAHAARPGYVAVR